MIISADPREGRQALISKIIDKGKKIPSRFGTCFTIEPELLVIENPEYIGRIDAKAWDICGESYADRVEPLFKAAAEKLKETPFTRRVSLPVWRPKDHLCHTPPAVTEMSFLVVDGKLHATAYVRSLDVLNYFKHTSDFVTYCLESIAELSGIEPGSSAFLIASPHIYERDEVRARNEAGETEYSEVFGVHELATHLVEDYMSTAWHSALEAIYYSGKEKRTEWGELFEGQAESKFVHRMFIEVRNPYEHAIHDKAPFTKKYGIEYAHEYVIYAACMDREVKENILKEGETYTYAERARYCEADDVKVDQLYTCIEKLKKDRFRRDCYVGISRPHDITSHEPPCLRGYQFLVSVERSVGSVSNTSASNAKTLNGIFYMRSNDAYGAMHANMFAFSLLTQYIAELTGFDHHKYFHFALDAHIYGEFLDSVREILEPETPGFSARK
jgi:thymidylate synthase